METPELATVDCVTPLPHRCPLLLVLPRCNPPTPPSHHLLLTTVRFVDPGSKGGLRGIRRDGTRKDNAVCFTLRSAVQATGRWHRLAWDNQY